MVALQIQTFTTGCRWQDEAAATLKAQKKVAAASSHKEAAGRGPVWLLAWTRLANESVKQTTYFMEMYLGHRLHISITDHNFHPSWIFIHNWHSRSYSIHFWGSMGLVTPLEGKMHQLPVRTPGGKSMFEESTAYRGNEGMNHQGLDINWWSIPWRWGKRLAHPAADWDEESMCVSSGFVSQVDILLRIRYGPVLNYGNVKPGKFTREETGQIGTMQRFWVLKSRGWLTIIHLFTTAAKGCQCRWCHSMSEISVQNCLVSIMQMVLAFVEEDMAIPLGFSGASSTVVLLALVGTRLAI